MSVEVPVSHIARVIAAAILMSAASSVSAEEMNIACTLKGKPVTLAYTLQENGKTLGWITTRAEKPIGWVDRASLKCGQSAPKPIKRSCPVGRDGKPLITGPARCLDDFQRDLVGSSPSTGALDHHRENAKQLLRR
jgi:hypothetical protein